MSEEKVVTLEKTEREQELEKEGVVLTAVENLLKRQREERDAQMASAIDKLSEIDLSRVPEIYHNPRESKGTAMARGPVDHLYTRLSEAEQQWRNPDSDHWCVDWLRGNLAKDYGRMLNASKKLEGIYGRAVMTEGFAGAGGAVSTGTGGELVPRPLEQVIYIARDKLAKMRRFATIYPMTAQQHNIPTAGSMTAAVVSEATGAAQSEPDVAQVALEAMVFGVQARVTRELLADAPAMTVMNVISTRAGSGLASLEDAEFFKEGTGTRPHVTKLSGTGYALTTATALAFTDMLGIYHTLGQQYRDNAVWFISSSVLQLLSNVRDGNGRQFYEGLVDRPGPITDDAGAIGTILRKPVYEVDLTSGDIWFGDPSQYAIGQRQGIEMDVSYEAQFLRRQVCIMVTERVAGNNTDTSAAQYTTAIASASSL
jgi:HK97 family phage major capsid protein